MPTLIAMGEPSSSAAAAQRASVDVSRRPPTRAASSLRRSSKSCELVYRVAADLNLADSFGERRQFGRNSRRSLSHRHFPDAGRSSRHRDKNFTRGKVERRRTQLEESVARYLAQLATADRQEPSEMLELKKTRIKERLENLTVEMAKLAAIEKQVLASPDQQISLTDPDSRSIATSGRGSRVVGYNVQTAVDTESHLIVAHEVTTSGSDRSQLANMARQAKAILEADTLDVVADRGYFTGEEILACEQSGITVTLPKPMTSGAKASGRFGKQDFAYLRDEDVYRCPASEKLKYYYTNEEDGQKLRNYWTNACKTCPLKSKCTPSPQRRIKRWVYEDVLERAQARLDKNRKRHARMPRDRRASVRHTEDAHGRDALLVRDAAESCDQDGTMRARLQSDTRAEHRRHETAAGGGEGVIRALVE